MLSERSRAVVTVGALIMTAACDTETLKTACRGDGICPPGRVCYDGSCRDLCVTDDDCGDLCTAVDDDGLRCREGVCVPGCGDLPDNPAGDPAADSGGDDPPVDATDPASEEPYVEHDHIDCVHVAGEPGENRYWIDSNGAPTELVEDCGYFGKELNCAGTAMTSGSGEANAAVSGSNPDAFVGCCGEQASTIDRCGCLPFASLGEPCFSEFFRCQGLCQPGLVCRNRDSDLAPGTCELE